MIKITRFWGFSRNINTILNINCKGWSCKWIFYVWFIVIIIDIDTGFWYKKCGIFDIVRRWGNAVGVICWSYFIIPLLFFTCNLVGILINTIEDIGSSRNYSKAIYEDWNLWELRMNKKLDVFFVILRDRINVFPSSISLFWGFYWKRIWLILPT